jgi:hypothetical protein
MPYLVEDVGNMKQRENNIWKWLSNLWGSYTKWITPAFTIGAIMVIISVVLIAIHNGISQAAGTAILAAGLTIIITTLTSRESIRQQFAKDANILHKDTIYGPLFTELKLISGWLEEAKRKEGATHNIFMEQAMNQKILNTCAILNILHFFYGLSLNKIIVSQVLRLRRVHCSMMFKN